MADYCTQKVFIHMHHIPPENALEHVLKIVNIGLNIHNLKIFLSGNTIALLICVCVFKITETL